MWLIGNTLFACFLYFGLIREIPQAYWALWFICIVWLVIGGFCYWALKLDDAELTKSLIEVRQTSFTNNHKTRQLDIAFDLMCILVMFATGNYILSIVAIAAMYVQNIFMDKIDAIRFSKTRNK